MAKVEKGATLPPFVFDRMRLAMPCGVGVTSVWSGSAVDSGMVPGFESFI